MSPLGCEFAGHANHEKCRRKKLPRGDARVTLWREGHEPPQNDLGEFRYQILGDHHA